MLMSCCGYGISIPSSWSCLYISVLTLCLTRLIWSGDLIQPLSSYWIAESPNSRNRTEGVGFSRIWFSSSAMVRSMSSSLSMSVP